MVIGQIPSRVHQGTFKPRKTGIDPRLCHLVTPRFDSTGNRSICKTLSRPPTNHDKSPTNPVSIGDCISSASQRPYAKGCDSRALCRCLLRTTVRFTKPHAQQIKRRHHPPAATGTMHFFSNPFAKKLRVAVRPKNIFARLRPPRRSTSSPRGATANARKPPAKISSIPLPNFFPRGFANW
jgi:hypothetical protein